MEGIIPPSMRRWVESSTWAAMAEHHTWDGINNRHLFLIVLVIGSPRSKYQLAAFLVRAQLLEGDSSGVSSASIRAIALPSVALP